MGETVGGGGDKGGKLIESRSRSKKKKGKKRERSSGGKRGEYYLDIDARRRQNDHVPLNKGKRMPKHGFKRHRVMNRAHCYSKKVDCKHEKDAKGTRKKDGTATKLVTSD